MSDEVLVEVDSAVARITLNRPDRLNAWSRGMNDGYLVALDQVSADPAVRVVVVTGAGRGFCAGADMSLLTDLADGDRPDADEVRPSYLLEPAVPKPVIAAINGPCAGIGLVRAAFCDLRFAVRGAKLTTAFARRGLVAEHGISWLLPRLVGLSTSLDLLVSGRTVLAEEAHSLGLVDRLVDDDVVGAATAYAVDLARMCSPASMRDIKAQVWRDLSRDVTGSVETADAMMLASFDRPDFVEGVGSYLDRRDPAFPPLA